MRATSFRLALFLLLLTATLARAVEPPDRALEAATRKEILNKLAERIVALYVLPEKGETIARSLRERLERGEYDKLTSSRELAEAVTRDLQEVSGDKHLQLSYNHEPPPPPEDPEARKARREALLADLRTNNQFFEKVERLSGNVGYLDLRYDPQNLGRAVLVGETTRGGAHYIEQIRLDDHFFVWLSIGRAVSPVTGTNWEGTGVKPDIAVPAAEAKARAHEEALRRLQRETVARSHDGRYDPTEPGMRVDGSERGR